MADHLQRGLSSQPFFPHPQGSNQRPSLRDPSPVFHSDQCNVGDQGQVGKEKKNELWPFYLVFIYRQKEYKQREIPCRQGRH
jgi:hypothetical protein